MALPHEDEGGARAGGRARRARRARAAGCAALRARARARAVAVGARGVEGRREPVNAASAAPAFGASVWLAPAAGRGGRDRREPRLRHLGRHDLQAGDQIGALHGGAHERANQLIVAKTIANPAPENWEWGRGGEAMRRG